MVEVGDLIRPHTLEEGKQYLLVENQDGNNDIFLTTVKFVSYTACPAIVIITDGAGRRIRCLRDDLFLWVADPTRPMSAENTQFLW
jgi:hypothetical protein